MASAIVNKAFETADKIALELDCSVIDIEYVKEDNDKILRVYIDKENGIGIDECESFSRAFDEEFDKLDVINEAYNLEVSSPGVDRILKTEREFEYYLGRKVSVKLYKAIDGKKELCGILKDFKDQTAIIDVEGNEVKIPQKEAVYIRLYFEM